MAQQVVTELVIDARSAAAGAAAYDAAMKKAEAAASRVIAVNDNAQAAIERSTVSMTQSSGRQAAAWNRVAAAADPVVAATLALERATTAGNAAMAKGVATADQVASTLAVYRSRLDAAAASSHRGTAATALNAGQVQNLTFQLNDMATMLASGQSPFVMLMQQGMQMAQVFGPGVGVGGALKATGAALVGFLTNPLTLAVVGMAAAAGAVSLLWDAVSSSGSAERALEEHKKLIEDIRDAYGQAGEAATSYATKSTQVLQFRTSSAVAENAAALNAALSDFARTYDPLFGAILVDFGNLNPMVHDFAQLIRDGTADLAGFQRELAAIGNATDDIQTDEAVRQVLALIEPLIALEDQARQTAGATQLFAGTLVTLGRTGTLRFADAFGDLDGLKGDLSGFLDEQNRAAEEAARTAEQRQDAIDGVITQLRFEEEQLARTAREQAIYNALKQAGVSIDSAAGQKVAEAAAKTYDAAEAHEELNKRLQEAKGYASGFFDTFLGGLQSGQGLVSSLSSAVGGLASKLGGDLLGSIGTNLGGGVGGILGSILGPLGSAIGNVAGGFLGDLFDSIFGGNDAEREAEREQRRAERRLKAQERRDKIDAKREKLEQQEEQRLAKQEARARRMEGYADRATVASLDTTTLSGQLAQFDLEAQREREQVLRDGGKKANKELAALDKALAAERLQIQRDFNDDMVAEAKRAQEEVNRTAGSILDYVNGLLSGPQSTASPQDRFTAAQSAFNSQYALAQSGNAEAQAGITDYAETFRAIAREMYASAPAYQAIESDIIQKLMALPAVQQADDPVVVALRDSITATLAVRAAVEAGATNMITAINAGPAATAAAMLPNFEAIDINASGGISLAEMQTALGSTNSVLTSIFNAIDTNGDGQLTQLELIAARTLDTANKLTGAAKDVTLGGLLTQSQLQSLGLSTDTKLSTLLTQSQMTALGLASNATVASLLTKAQVQSLGLSTDTKLSTLLTSSQMASLKLASNATLGTLLTSAQLSALGLAKDANVVNKLEKIRERDAAIASNTVGAAKDASLNGTTTNLGKVANNTAGVAKDASLKAKSGETLSTTLITVGSLLQSAAQNEFLLTTTITGQLIPAINTIGRASGGMIPRFAAGGTVGNGAYNVDSVRARYAGGGDIMLAGGEFVTRATSVNAMTMPILDAINRTGRPASLSSVVANDNGKYFADQNRVLIAGFRATIQALETELAMLRAAVERSGERTARAVERKPVAKPATKVA